MPRLIQFFSRLSRASPPNEGCWDFTVKMLWDNFKIFDIWYYHYFLFVIEVCIIKNCTYIANNAYHFIVCVRFLLNYPKCSNDNLCATRFSGCIFGNNFKLGLNGEYIPKCATHHMQWLLWVFRHRAEWCVSIASIYNVDQYFVTVSIPIMKTPAIIIRKVEYFPLLLWNSRNLPL